MACNDTTAAPASDECNLIVEVKKACFAAIVAALVSAACTNRRVQLAERLSEKSDDELATLGIRREDILRCVFHDYIDM